MGNTTLNRRISARRIAAVLAALGALVMSSGIALMVTATPASADAGTNDPDYWETLPGEQCYKIDSGSDSGGFEMPDEPEGRDWSKLIIKKGSGNIGEENQVFDDPVAGQTYTWQGYDSKQDGGWSHLILCSVPEPEEEPTLIEVDIVFTDPTCENENTASFHVTGDVADTDGGVSAPAPAPGADVTVTVTAKPGFTFSDGDTYSESHEFGEAEEPCGSVEPPEVPEPQFVDPTCDTAPQVLLPEEQEGEVLYRTTGAPFLTKDVNGIHYEATGDLVPGGTVTVTATLIEGGDGPLATWSHTFTIPTGCTTSVLPPEETESNTVSTPTQSTVTPTVVHAGLAGTTAEDVRGEQGLALMVAGMVMLVAAGGLRLRGSRSRI